MSNIDTRRIAERFAGLPVEQRRAVYDKIRTQGLGIGQFPILSRPVTTDSLLTLLCPTSPVVSVAHGSSKQRLPYYWCSDP